MTVSLSTFDFSLQSYGVTTRATAAEAEITHIALKVFDSTIAPLERLQKPHVTEKYLRSLHHHDLSRPLYYYAKEKRLM